MKKALFFLSVVVALLSCKKEEMQEPDYLIFGYFSCFCSDCCKDAYKITEGQLFKGEKTGQTQFEFGTTPLGTSKYEIAQKLLDELPDGLYADNGKLLGCGGCLDQPVFYVEYQKEGVVYHWKIDSSMDLPEYLTGYAKLLTDVMNQLK